MATATVTRPTAPPTPAMTAASAGPERTTSEKAVAVVVVGAASAATVGVFAWAVWVASQISIPV